MPAQFTRRRRQVVIFHDCIEIWRGFRVGNRPRQYPMTRRRARGLGRLLDGGATIKSLGNGELYYTWNDFYKMEASDEAE